MDVSKQTRQTIGEVASTRSERECPVCGSMDLAPFVDVLDIPVHVGHLWPTAEQARRAPTGDIKAAFCRGCGYVWNMAFDPSKVTYAPGYDHSLHHSAYYQSFIDALALELIKRYDLHGKTIVEIGCGNGDFLRTICRLGDNRGIGFDPSVEPADRGDDGERVTFIQDFYSERYADDGADFICSRHVLVQLPEPREFMGCVRFQNQRLSVGSRSGGTAARNRGHAADRVGGAAGGGNGTRRPRAEGRPRRRGAGAVSGNGWAGRRSTSPRV